LLERQKVIGKPSWGRVASDKRTRGGPEARGLEQDPGVMGISLLSASYRGGEATAAQKKAERRKARNCLW